MDRKSLPYFLSFDGETVFFYRFSCYFCINSINFEFNCKSYKVQISKSKEFTSGLLNLAKFSTEFSSIGLISFNIIFFSSVVLNLLKASPYKKKLTWWILPLSIRPWYLSWLILPTICFYSDLRKVVLDPCFNWTAEV